MSDTSTISTQLIDHLVPFAKKIVYYIKSTIEFSNKRENYYKQTNNVNYSLIEVNVNLKCAFFCHYLHDMNVQLITQ